MLHIQTLPCMHCLVGATGIEMEHTVIGILTDLRKTSSRLSQNTSKIGDILHVGMPIQN